MIKVVRGNPTPEELAAAVAVVRARAAMASAEESAWPNGTGAPGAPGAPSTQDAWADPARVARTRLPAPGPRAWRRTFWPG